MPLTALAGLALAELALGGGAEAWALVLHALLIAALVGVGSLATRTVRAVGLALLPLPVARLVAALMPGAMEEGALRLGWMVAAAGLTTALAARASGLDHRAWLGMRGSRWDPWLVLVAVAATALALNVTSLAAWIPGLGRGGGGVGAWPVIALAGFVEELAFRGLLQRAAVLHWGIRRGVAFGAVAYAVMHLSWAPWPWALGAGVVGLGLGGAVAYTRSLLGVGVAHALVGVMVWAVAARA